MEKKIEALLFALGRPLTRAELQKYLGADVGEIDEAIERIQRRDVGIVLVDDGKMVELRAAGEVAALIEKARREEYSRDIGRAGNEVLAALLYRGPQTRPEIDFIRGVNSSQTLRTLAMRGLVRKVPNPRDKTAPEGRRGFFLYEPTTELLAHLGVARDANLPDYAEIRGKLEALEKSYREREELKEL